jgi:twitching motility protein PilT
MDALLIQGVRLGATDIHFKAGDPPVYRIAGKLQSVEGERLVPADTEAICSFLLKRNLGAQNLQNLQNVQEQDSSYSLDGIGRFRVNAYRQRGSLSCVLRVIPSDIPTIDGMGLPPAVKTLAEYKQGIVLVTGSTGSGKSTTLAAMIDHVNRASAVHILTIEDPIEFLHRNAKASVSQREVGPDTHGFNTALRAALWQDPDVILVGEMQDPETIDLALRAAETGHMVFSAVQATDASRAINHLLEAIPIRSRNRARNRLADTLCGIVGQRLLRRADGRGRVAACEILVANATVQEHIRQGCDGSLNRIMEREGASYGMQTFDQHLQQLYQEGIIPRIASSSILPRSDDHRSVSRGPLEPDAVQVIAESESSFREEREP